MYSSWSHIHNSESQKASKCRKIFVTNLTAKLDLQGGEVICILYFSHLAGTSIVSLWKYACVLTGCCSDLPGDSPEYSGHARYYFSKTQNILNPGACGIWIKEGGPAFYPVVHFILTLALDISVVTYKVLWGGFTAGLNLILCALEVVE